MTEHTVEHPVEREQATATAPSSAKTGAPNGLTNGHRGESTSSPQTPKKSGGIVRILFFLILICGAGVAGYFRGTEQLKKDAESLYEFAHEQVAGKPAPPVEKIVISREFNEKWDGLVKVTAKEAEALGIAVVPVEKQSEPLRLEFNGTTDYDQNNLAKVRPLFDARVQQVFKSTGQAVSKGDELVELFSNELLGAKNDLRTKYVQWDHDLKLMESRRPLVEKGAITQVAWTDTVNAEKKSRVDYFQSREKLLIFGLTNAEVDALISNLGDNVKNPLAEEEAKKLSKMSVKAPMEGVIVERNVVSGNFYDANDILMVISPMDHLWVWVNVFERDQSKVKLGQLIDVSFPFLDQSVKGQVESIDNRVDPVTRSIRIRASVPNPKKTLKADMLVRAFLEIPANEGQTWIPRNAMAVQNGLNCVFIQRADNPEKFERRVIEIDLERADRVVVAKGIKAGERVVTNGSLIMSQLYEDLSTVESGMPMK